MRYKTVFIVVSVILVFVGLGCIKQLETNSVNSDRGTSDTPISDGRTVVVGDRFADVSSMIRMCDRPFTSSLPEASTLSEIGIGNLLADGYALVDICRDGELSNQAAFILAKKENNWLTNSRQDDACIGSCDRVAFGTADFENGEVKVVLSDHRLGIHGEAYDAFCMLDTYDSDKGLLYFYCGTGESGGLTTWKVYDFSMDFLEKAQTLILSDPDGDEYEVHDQDLLKGFKHKTRVEECEVRIGRPCN